MFSRCWSIDQSWVGLLPKPYRSFGPVTHSYLVPPGIGMKPERLPINRQRQSCGGDLAGGSGRDAGARQRFAHFAVSTGWLHYAMLRDELVLVHAEGPDGSVSVPFDSRLCHTPAVASVRNAIRLRRFRRLTRRIARAL